MKFTRPLLDYRGMKLCDPCWNGRHWHKALHVGKQGGLFDNKGGVVWDCIGPPCECHCRQMYREQTEHRKQVKPDHSQQMVIEGCDVRPENKHKDTN